MKRMFKRALPAMLAMLTLSAIAATAAQAEEAPFFKVAGARLVEGESKEVTAASGSEIILSRENGVTIRCHVAFASGAKLLGSKASEPGKAEMTMKFSACHVENLGTGCKVEVVALAPIKATLVYLESSKKGLLGALLYPAKGAKFLEVIYSGSPCKLSGDEKLEGEIAVQLISGGGGVEVGKEPAEAKTLGFRFPETVINHVWEVRGGVGSEVHVELNSGVFLTQVTGGTITLELAGDPNWGVFA